MTYGSGCPLTGVGRAPFLTFCNAALLLRLQAEVESCKCSSAGKTPPSVGLDTPDQIL